MEPIIKETFLSELFFAAEANGLSELLPDSAAEKLYALTVRMLEINEKFNLTAIKEPSRIILLHYVDSLLAARHIPENATVIDVGCGAGFPSLPLAICRPDLKITAMDATAKRVAYVKDTAEFLSLGGLSTLTGRAEELGNDPALRERFDVATARAVAALPVLSELCMPFVRKGGIFLALKGKNAEAERREAEGAIVRLGGRVSDVDETPVVGKEGETFARAAISIQKNEKTPKEYPRPYGKILKKPLA
ncbi:MAG: 16S rRNA (guanine(527)-N(7))-methyltransferase RsmG [Clostridia bacterium]|nr:16S rRNA (guanine(527)-N(7))-methyltransferase RsmG [Clostridia bacterium]